MKNKAAVFLSLLLINVSHAGTYPSSQCNGCKKTQSITHANFNKNIPYISAAVGQSMQATKYRDRDLYGNTTNPSWLLGLGGGVMLNEAVSLDMTVNHRMKFTYRESKITQNISSTSIMFNGYYMVPTNTISPYMMAGVGIAFNRPGQYTAQVDEEKMTIDGKASRNFAWQVGPGIRFKASDSVSLDLGYRYINLGNLKNSGNGQISGVTHSPGLNVMGALRTHELLLTMVYKL